MKSVNNSWLRYIACLIMGNGLHFESCLIIPGWIKDFVYRREPNGNRIAEYVPSRIVRFLRCGPSTLHSVSKSMIEFLTRGVVAFAGDSCTATLVRWTVSLIASVLLPRVVDTMVG